MIPPTMQPTMIPMRATGIPLGPLGVEVAGTEDVALEGWLVEVVPDMLVD